MNCGAMPLSVSIKDLDKCYDITLILLFTRTEKICANTQCYSC